MKVLVVKLTSMGDVIHALPALSDAQAALPGIRFDFLVEESFQEIPHWHPAVEQVIPVATRRWRKSLWRSRGEIRQTLRHLRSSEYDYVIDIQGLLKSGLLSRLAKGVRCGYDRDSIRETLACHFYHHRFAVSRQRHAIERVRSLFSQALGYAEPLKDDPVDYRITLPQKIKLPIQTVSDYCVFLHGTTWRAKEWPEASWRQLLASYADSGQPVYLPWGNAAEQARAERLQAGLPHVSVLPKMTLSQLCLFIKNAQGVVAVDTGLGHLAAALGRPTVSIYGPTDTRLIGTVGANQMHLCVNEHSISSSATSGFKKTAAFDYATVTPTKVKQSLNKLIGQTT